LYALLRVSELGEAEGEGRHEDMALLGRSRAAFRLAVKQP
jgi:hypothetical protein